MKVLCPFAPGRLRPETVEALEIYAPNYVTFNVGGDGGQHHNADDYVYGKFLSHHWAIGEPFILIEHDIVIHDKVIPEFETCDSPWCSFPYNTGQGGRMFAALGCVRFSQHLLYTTKDFAGYLAISPWFALDQVVTNALVDHGFAKAHCHWPIVGHYHNQIDDKFEDTREERDIRRQRDPKSVTITKMTDKIATSQQTDLGGMRIMGIDKWFPLPPSSHELEEVG